MKLGNRSSSIDNCSMPYLGLTSAIPAPAQQPACGFKNPANPMPARQDATSDGTPTSLAPTNSSLHVYRLSPVSWCEPPSPEFDTLPGRPSFDKRGHRVWLSRKSSCAEQGEHTANASCLCPVPHCTPHPGVLNDLFTCGHQMPVTTDQVQYITHGPWALEQHMATYNNCASSTVYNA